MAIRYSEVQARIYRFAEAEKPLTVVTGPVRSGKTLPAVEGFLSWATAAPEHDYMLTAPTMNQVQRVILPIVADWASLAGMHYEVRRQDAYVRVGGTKFYFASSSDERSEMRIRGLTLRGNYLDELTLIDEQYFDMLRLRMVGQPGHRTIATTNPAGMRHWARRRFVADDAPEAADTQVIATTMLDNPLITPEEFAQLEQRYHGAMRERMIYGKWADVSGAIYPMASVSIEPVPTSAPVMAVLAADYAHSSVAHWSLFTQHPEGWWLAREGRHDASEAGLVTDAALSTMVRIWLGGTKPRRVYLDPAAQGWSSALAQALGMRVHNADNRVVEGIRQTRAFLETGTLRIDPGCAYTLGEMAMYSWDRKAAEQGEDKPVKKDDHAMDALRYFVLSHGRHMVRRAA